MPAITHRGRPRIHVTNAARQKEYRRRIKQQKTDSHWWNKRLVEHGLSMSQGAFLKDAPAGRGLLHSGGNDSVNLDLLIARDEEHLSGRRVRPHGTSPNDAEGEARGNSGRLEDIDPGRLIQRELELMDAEEAERILKYKECK